MNEKEAKRWCRALSAGKKGGSTTLTNNPLQEISKHERKFIIPKSLNTIWTNVKLYHI